MLALTPNEQRATVATDEQREAFRRTLRPRLPLVIREWEQWARLGTTPPTGGLLPPDGVPAPGEVAATAAELADAAFLEAAADGAVEAAELAREAEASDIGAGTL